MRRAAAVLAGLLACGLVAAAAADPIVSARYAGPTDRYNHGVLGDRIEWSSLIVRTASGRQSRFDIQDASVFEDIAPRLADIDGDGLPEAWVIRSDATDGARLEAYGLADGALSPRYAGPAIGTGFRWLNPLGIGDFDGDGAPEAAYIETPHIGGILTVVRPEGDRLQIVARAQSYSTHAIGSTQLDLGAIHDIDGDGADDMIVPTQLHDRLAVLSLRDSRLVERWRSGPLKRIAGGLRIRPTQSGVEASYRTTDGGTAILSIPAQALTPLR